MSEKYPDGTGKVPALATTIFVIPKEYVKNHNRIVVLIIAPKS